VYLFVNILLGIENDEGHQKYLSDVSKFEDKPLSLSNDSYSLAFAAVLNPMEIEHLRKNNAKCTIQRVHLLNSERDSMFASAMAVASCQLIYLIMIFKYFQSANIEFGKVSNFSVLIPRLLSSVMMQLIVIPDARQGLLIMKYAINHPWMFRYSEDEPAEPENDPFGDDAEEQLLYNPP
jgi:hypothetical protein